MDLHFDMQQIIAGFIFGSIGFIAFTYGKRQSQMKPLLIGLGLMMYPYFVADTIPLYAVGVVLTAALFLFRD